MWGQPLLILHFHFSRLTLIWSRCRCWRQSTEPGPSSAGTTPMPRRPYPPYRFISLLLITAAQHRMQDRFGVSNQGGVKNGFFFWNILSIRLMCRLGRFDIGPIEVWQYQFHNSEVSHLFPHCSFVPGAHGVAASIRLTTPGPKLTPGGQWRAAMRVAQLK